MGVDVIARAVAAANKNDISAALAKVAPQGLFSSIGTRAIDASVSAIVTSGYAAHGSGPGRYVSDSLATAALAAAHPRFCKAAANGRYFRLVPDAGGEITVRQGGAIATGNDREAIQATIDYACAVGIETVYFPDTKYDLWCPIRTSAYSADATDGHMLVISTRDGVRLRGNPGKTRLNLFNSVGGPRSTVTQSNGDFNWLGGGIYVLPNLVGGVREVQWVAVENLIVAGNVPYAGPETGNAGFEMYDKGLRVQGVTCRHLYVRNCEFRDFGGEIYYVGGSTVDYQEVTDSIFHGSPQSAFNPSSTGRVYARNVQAGWSYQAFEVIGADGMTFDTCRFYDFYSCGIGGGPNAALPLGAPFNYSWRDPALLPPWAHFNDCRFENAMDGLYVSSWCRGRVSVVDCGLIISGHNCSDVNFDVEAWVDKKSAVAAVILAGPPDITTPIWTGGAAREPLKNTHIDVVCKRTKLAAANNRYFAAAVDIYNGIVDAATCSVTVRGDAQAVFRAPASPIPGFQLPRIDFQQFRPTNGMGTAGGADYPASNKTYDVLWAEMSLWANGGPWDIQLGTNYTYADGQRVTFWYDGANGGPLRFPAKGTGLSLPTDRKLYGQGDRLGLIWSTRKGKWVEDFYETATQTTFAGSMIYDAPSIAAGASVTTAVTVAGASLGDFVECISLGVDGLGLTVSGYVSAENTVTVVLQNATGAAVDLALTTLSVVVVKK